MIAMQTNLFGDCADFNRQCYAWDREHDKNHVATPRHVVEDIYKLIKIESFRSIKLIRKTFREDLKGRFELMSLLKNLYRTKKKPDFDRNGDPIPIRGWRDQLERRIFYDKEAQDYLIGTNDGLFYVSGSDKEGEVVAVTSSRAEALSFRSVDCALQFCEDHSLNPVYVVWKAGKDDLA